VDVLSSTHVVPRAVQDSQSKISAGFTAAHRLLRQDGFDHVVCAESTDNKYFKVFFVRKSQENARLGIIASKKILPRAVHRNRVKRIIREVFRQHSIKACGLDMVVMVRRAYTQERGIRSDSLNMLFSRVEDRCAEL